MPEFPHSTNDFLEFCLKHHIPCERQTIEALQDDLNEIVQGEFEDEWEDLARVLMKSERPPQELLRELRAERRFYTKELRTLQAELIQLQDWVVESGEKVIVLFEGRDAAGKGGVIKAITKRLNPRVVNVVALARPSEEERTQWYFQRYVKHLPSAGKIVLFDRSWYNRAGVERVMGFASDEEVELFFHSVPLFEDMLVRAGIRLVKYWFSVSDQEQETRFLSRIHDPLKQWKLSPMDLQSRIRWESYTKAKEEMLVRTSTRSAPWHVVPADNKRRSRLNCISHLLAQFDYVALEKEEIQLPARAHDEHYRRNPVPRSMIVPEKY